MTLKKLRRSLHQHYIKKISIYIEITSILIIRITGASKKNHFGNIHIYIILYYNN